MSILTKVLSVVALTCVTLVVACNHKGKQSKVIAASADSKGTHPANATVNGPVAVTCVSATDDSGNTTPPACVIEAPGTSGVVDIGHKVEIAGTGDVVLTCKGSGTLNCTARIEEPSTGEKTP